MKSEKLTVKLPVFVSPASAPVSVPPNLFSGPTNLAITREQQHVLTSPSGDQQLVGAWQIEASDASGSITTLPGSITVTFHLSAVDLPGRDPATLAFWTREDATQPWTLVPASVDRQNGIITAALDHFSEDAATANSLVDMAPVLNGEQVSTQTGSAHIDIPIVVPQGRDGLAPQLDLSYDSGRLGEMRQMGATGSWVGEGWDLDVGSVKLSADSTNSGLDRITVDLPGLGGELLVDGCPASCGTTAHIDHHPEARVQVFGDLGPGDPYCLPGGSIYEQEICRYVITDKQGRQYTFGGDAGHSRSYFIPFTWNGGTGGVYSYYQFDLSTITDPHSGTDTQGNRLNKVQYAYWQQPATDVVHCNPSQPPIVPGNCSYVIAAYPRSISYNDGQSQILFNPAPGGQVTFGSSPSCDGPPDTTGLPAGMGPPVCMRSDTPRDEVTNCTSDPWYVAPSVRETQRLNRIEEWQNGAFVRAYSFTYQMQPFYLWVNAGEFGCNATPFVGTPGCTGCPPCTSGCVYEGSAMLLKTFAMVDNGQPSPASLYNMAFDYALKHSALITSSYPAPPGFEWKYLTEADNGVGGSVTYDYEEEDNGCVCAHWSREVVHTEKHRAGANEPDVLTTFDYGVGPDEYDYPSPYEQPNPGDSPGAYQFGFTGYDVQDAIDRGFWRVTETTGSGTAKTSTEHTYDTTASTCCFGSTLYPYGSFCCDASFQPFPAANWQKDLLAGTETNTVVRDGNGATLRTTATMPGVTPLSGGYAFNPLASGGPSRAFAPPGQVFVNFAYPQQTTTTLQDGSQTSTKYTYDVNDQAIPTPVGNVEQSSSFVGATPTLITKTQTAYDTADWIFVPKLTEQIDPQTSALLSCARDYYDGATSFGTLTAGSAYGLLTAKSVATALGTTTAQCEAGGALPSAPSNTYTAYDQYGNAVASSVVTGAIPESNPAHAALTPPVTGWVPAAVPYATTAYDAAYAAVLPTTQNTASDAHAVAEQTSTTYSAFGTPLVVTSPQGDHTNSAYDTLGRLTDVWDDTDSQQYPTKRFKYDWGTAGLNRTVTVDRVTKLTTDAKVSVSCADGMGREVDRITSFWSGTAIAWSEVRTDYDAQGRKAVTTNAVPISPSFDADGFPLCPTQLSDVTSADRTSYAYDALGNVTTTTYLTAGNVTDTNCTAPLGSQATPCTQTTTVGLTTTRIDELGHKTVTTRDPAQTNDQTLRTSITTHYTGNGNASAPWMPWITPVPYAAYAKTWSRYDALGRLARVNDATADPSGNGGNETRITYDLAGHKTAMTDPDMHNWTYGYDAAGNLTSQTDARGITTTLKYDALNRLYEKDYSNGQPTATFTYDQQPLVVCAGDSAQWSVGRLTSTLVGGANSSHTQTCFDARGEATFALVGGPDQSAFVRTTYNDAGAPTTITYPSGEIVTYDSAPDGSLRSLTSSTNGPIASQASYDPTGALASFRYGAGVASSTYSYDSRLRMQEITTQTGLTTAQDLVLTYDDASNVHSTSSTLGSPTENLTYTYDDLNRLTGATGYLDGSRDCYTYDTIGNLLQKDEGDVTSCQGGLNLTYPAMVSSVSLPHAVSDAKVGSTIWQAFTYDMDGNQVGSGTAVFPGAPPSNRSLNTFYEYDADGRLTVIDRGTAASTTSGWKCIDANDTPDGIVNILDLSKMAGIYNQGYGSPTFAPRLDVNWDGRVNILDLAAEAVHYNTTTDCTSDRTQYIRAAAGDVVERVNTSTSGRTWTLYAPGGVAELSGTTQTEYYMAFGRAVAMQQLPAGGGVTYLLADHLGTTVGVLDNTGALTGTATYWPYGAPRTATGVLAGVAAGTDRRYTGQRQQPPDAAFGDTTLGLYNYKARFYSATLGRFVSADTVADGLNRYAYVHDNPLRYTDSTGGCFTLPDGTKIKACGSNDILRWIECAMGIGCSGDVRLLAEAGTASVDFWNRAGVLNVDTFLKYNIINSIVEGSAHGGSFTFGAGFWQGLGSLFLVSGRFMAASTHDLIYGTDDILGLSADSMIGAYDWWESPPSGLGSDQSWFVYTAHWNADESLSYGAQGSHMDSMFGELWDQTVYAGWELAGLGGNELLNSKNWSPLQLQFLSGDHLNVDEAAVRTRRQLFQDTIKECFAQSRGNCVSDIIEQALQREGMY